MQACTQFSGVGTGGFPGDSDLITDLNNKKSSNLPPGVMPKFSVQIPSSIKDFTKPEMVPDVRKENFKEVIDLISNVRKKVIDEIKKKGKNISRKQWANLVFPEGAVAEPRASSLIPSLCQDVQRSLYNTRLTLYFGGREIAKVFKKLFPSTIVRHVFRDFRDLSEWTGVTKALRTLGVSQKCSALMKRCSKLFDSLNTQVLSLGCFKRGVDYYEKALFAYDCLSLSQRNSHLEKDKDPRQWMRDPKFCGDLEYFKLTAKLMKTDEQKIQSFPFLIAAHFKMAQAYLFRWMGSREFSDCLEELTRSSPLPVRNKARAKIGTEILHLQAAIESSSQVINLMEQRLLCYERLIKERCQSKECRLEKLKERLPSLLAVRDVLNGFCEGRDRILLAQSLSEISYSDPENVHALRKGVKKLKKVVDQLSREITDSEITATLKNNKTIFFR